MSPNVLWEIKKIDEELKNLIRIEEIFCKIK